MSINTIFVLSGLFVPNLWSVAEFLFQLALTGFAAIGLCATKILTTYFARTLTNGNAVGFAAPAAMS